MVTVCIAILSASVSTKGMKNANGHYCFQNVAKPIRDHCCQKTTPDVHQQPRKPIPLLLLFYGLWWLVTRSYDAGEAVFQELIEQHVTIQRLTTSMPGVRFVLAMILAL